MGNPHRKRGTGKGTRAAWKKAGLEGELVLPEVSAQPDKMEKKAKVIDINPRNPIPAESIHSGPILPENKAENVGSLAEYEDQDTAVDAEKEKKPMYRAGPTPEAAAREPLAPESDEEKLAKLEERITSDQFSEAEREFFEVMIKKYPHELHVAKEKIEKKGGIADDKWAEVVRTSYINERKRLGLEKNRWGSRIPLSREKAELFEKYLGLKLPVGLPEKMPAAGAQDAEEMPAHIPTEKIAAAADNDDEKKSFTPKQSSELIQLIGIASKLFKKWVKDSEQSGEELDGKNTQKRAIFDQMKGMMNDLILNDPVMKNIFSEEEVPRAAEHAMKYVEKFNFNFKK